MKNSQFIEDRINTFLKNKDGIIMFIHSNGWAVVTPATFEKRQSFVFNWREHHQHGSIDFSKLCASTTVSDKELIKLWPHRTRKNFWGEFKTDEIISVELRKRGYKLNGFGIWKKNEVHT
jgi:hypothetical protein